MELSDAVIRRADLCNRGNRASAFNHMITSTSGTWTADVPTGLSGAETPDGVCGDKDGQMNGPIGTDKRVGGRGAEERDRRGRREDTSEKS